MKILLVDDHPLIRQGIKPFLEELDDDVTVTETENFEDTIEVMKKDSSYDLVLLDLKLPDVENFFGIQQIFQKFPKIPVVAFSGQCSRNDVLKAIRSGASGYIPKTLSPQATINALRLVLSGEKYIPSSAFIGDDENIMSSTEMEEGEKLFATLTNREKEVLKLLNDAKSNKEIANKLDVREVTVKVHLKNIYSKIKASNRTHATRMASHYGWFTD